LEVDDYVHVAGTVAGQMEGENMMRGTVTAVMVEADEVDVVSGVEAVDPTPEDLGDRKDPRPTKTSASSSKR
jgi:hypothetical protein